MNFYLIIKHCWFSYDFWSTVNDNQGEKNNYFCYVWIPHITFAWLIVIVVFWRLLNESIAPGILDWLLDGIVRWIPCCLLCNCTFTMNICILEIVIWNPLHDRRYCTDSEYTERFDTGGCSVGPRGPHTNLFFSHQSNHTFLPYYN